MTVERRSKVSAFGACHWLALLQNAGMNRRHFLKTAAVAGFAWRPGQVLPPTSSHLGSVSGSSVQAGMANVICCVCCKLAPVDVVSLCDVDRRMLSGAADLFAERQQSKQRPRTYGDYREMLKERDLDLVLIATPDHWHALAMIAAVEAGRMCMCKTHERGCGGKSGHAVRGAKAWSRGAGRRWRRSTPHLIEARREVFQSGKLGKISHAELCCYYPMRTHENPPDSNPPEYLDYEMWTGPARCVRITNWCIRAAGGLSTNTATESSGTCVHMLDPVRWFLDLGWPTRFICGQDFRGQRQQGQHLGYAIGHV